MKIEILMIVFTLTTIDSNKLYDEKEDNIDYDDLEEKQLAQEDEVFQEYDRFQEDGKFQRDGRFQEDGEFPKDGESLENGRFQKDGGFLEDEGFLEEEGLLDEDRFLDDEQFLEDQRINEVQERELEDFRGEMEEKARKRSADKDTDQQEQQDCDEQLPTKEDIIRQLKGTNKYSNEQMDVFKELSQDELITDITKEEDEEKDENVMNDPKPKPWWFWGRRRGIRFPKRHCKY